MQGLEDRGSLLLGALRHVLRDSQQLVLRLCPSGDLGYQSIKED